MGLCSSSEKGKDSSVVASHVNHMQSNGDNVVTVLDSDHSLKKSKSGSKTDAFFDSRAWIDSDCDDDFVSINEDFIPSEGSTPSRNPSIDFLKSRSKNSFTFESKSEPSPTGGEKLNDFLQRTPEQTASDMKSGTNTTHEEIENQTTSIQIHGIADSKTSTNLEK